MVEREFIHMRPGTLLRVTDAVAGNPKQFDLFYVLGEHGYIYRFKGLDIERAYPVVCTSLATGCELEFDPSELEVNDEL